MSVIEVKTCDTCTHRGSCDKAELDKPSCVSYQVGYKKVVVIKGSCENLARMLDTLRDNAENGVVPIIGMSTELYNIEVPETFICDDIIIETKQEIGGK